MWQATVHMVMENNQSVRSFQEPGRAKKDPVLQILGTCALITLITSNHRGADKEVDSHFLYFSPLLQAPPPLAEVTFR